MSSPTNSTVNLLTSKSSSVPTKDYSFAFATLQSSYGFGAPVPVLPSIQEKEKSSTARSIPHCRCRLSFPSLKRKTTKADSSLSPSSLPLSSSEKQYNENFGKLQSVYGLSAGFAPIPVIRGSK